MAMRWYIMHASSNFEHRVAQAIRAEAKSRGLARLFDHAVGDGGILVPVERVIEVRGEKRADAERKCFPGYVLVRCEMTDELQRLLRAIPKVTGFLGKADEPMPIADAEIDRIIAMVRSDVRAAVRRPVTHTMQYIG